MANKNTGKPYEVLVQEIYQAILDYEYADAGYKRIEVQHDVKLLGKTGNVHQIDVFWSFELAGIEYKTLVEVKDWKYPVKKEHLHSFKSVLDDVPGSPRGCFVSKSGFQSGALTAAKHHGIKLITITEENPQFSIWIEHVVTHYNGAEMSVDEEWFARKNLKGETLAELSKTTTQEKAILLNPKQDRVQLYDLMCKDAEPYWFSKDDVLHTIEKKLEGDWYWLTGSTDVPKIKITDYKFTCYNKRSIAKLDVTIKEFPGYIIDDILEGKTYKYDALEKAINLRLP